MTLAILGIETSCDETAASVVERGPNGRVQILSSVISSQVAIHARFGGVVPEIAARSHVEAIDGVVATAMSQSGLGMQDLTAVAATAGPGLIGGVMVGLSFAKAIALTRNIPLIAVNHLEGHALSARLEDDVPYPFLLLLVSGGHCQILDVAGVGNCRRLGTTIDDAAGEAFDKIAKVLGLGYPGGPALERLAEGGDPTRFELPRALLGRKDMDFSFSGLKTAAARQAAGLEHEPERRDLAASVQAAISKQLTERSERAMKALAERLLPGDRRFVGAAQRHGFSFHAPSLVYCTDNAAMIALAGLERFELGLVDDLSVAARPRWPLDREAAGLSPSHFAGRKGPKA